MNIIFYSSIPSQSSQIFYIDVKCMKTGLIKMNNFSIRFKSDKNNK